MVAQNLDLKPERVPELDEVFDKVFERYLERKQLERAERELAAFQRDAVARVAGRKEGESDDSIWDATLAAWKAARPGVAVFDEQTGLFIGSRVPLSAPPPEGATPEAQAAHRRRDFVRQGGYGLVKQGAARGDATDASPGTFGRSLLKDESRGPESTSSAYLVRVSERVYPSKAELSPREYAEYLSAHVFGERRDRPAGAPMSSVANRAGAMNARVARYFEEFAELQPRFDLQDEPQPRRRARHALAAGLASRGCVAGSGAWRARAAPGRCRAARGRGLRLPRGGNAADVARPATVPRRAPCARTASRA